MCMKIVNFETILMVTLSTFVLQPVLERPSEVTDGTYIALVSDVVILIIKIPTRATKRSTIWRRLRSIEINTTWNKNYFRTPRDSRRKIMILEAFLKFWSEFWFFFVKLLGPYAGASILPTPKHTRVAWYIPGRTKHTIVSTSVEKVVGVAAPGWCARHHPRQLDGYLINFEIKFQIYENLIFWFNVIAPLGAIT